MRHHYHLSGIGLLLTSIVLSTAPATAASLIAHVQDDTGKPVADAVVYAAPRGRAFPKTPPRERVVMDQRDLQFMPYVLPVQIGTPVYFPNSDNIRHHVYSFSPAKIFELPLYKGTPMAAVVFDKPGAVVLGCNIHDWMLGYIYVLETPYFGKTGDRGEARLSSLPAGEVEVRVWHPRLKDGVDKTLRPATLSAGGETRIEFSIRLNPDRRKQRPVFSDDAASGYSY
jgi:plastocyanin